MMLWRTASIAARLELQLVSCFTDVTGMLVWLHSTKDVEESRQEADQLTRLALHQEQHPWHMARDEKKCANARKDAPQEG